MEDVPYHSIYSVKRQRHRLRKQIKTLNTKTQEQRNMSERKRKGTQTHQYLNPNRTNRHNEIHRKGHSKTDEINVFWHNLYIPGGGAYVSCKEHTKADVLGHGGQLHPVKAVVQARQRATNWLRPQQRSRSTHSHKSTHNSGVAVAARCPVPRKCTTFAHSSAFASTPSPTGGQSTDTVIGVNRNTQPRLTRQPRSTHFVPLN